MVNAIRLLLLELTLALAAIAVAQTPDLDAIDAALSERTSHLARITAEIEDENISDERLRSVLDDLLGDLDETEKDLRTLRTAREEPSRQLSNIGPPPGEDEPPESSQIVSLRKDLNERLSRLNGMVTTTELTITSINQLIDRVRSLNQTRSRAQLEARVDSPLSPRMWLTAAKALKPVPAHVSESLVNWWKNSRAADVWLLATALAAAVALIAFLLVPARRRATWLPGQAAPSTRIDRQRQVAANSIVASILVAAAGGIIWIASAESGLIALDSHLGRLLWIGASVLALSLTATRVALPPGQQESLLPVAANATDRLRWLFGISMVLFVADRILAAIIETAGGGIAASNAQATVTTTAFAVLLWLITQRRNWRLEPDEEPSGPSAAVGATGSVTDNSDNPSATISSASGAAEADRTAARPAMIRLRNVTRIGGRALALILLTLLVLGYIRMSEFIFHRVVLVGVFILFIWCLRVLAKWAVARIPAANKSSTARKDAPQDEAPLGLLLELVLNLALAGISIPILLLIVGFDWLDVARSLNWLTQDIQLGAINLSFRNLVSAVLALLLISTLTRWLTNIVDRRFAQRLRIQQGLRDLMMTIVNYVGLAVAIIVALSIVGVELSQLALIAGALSVGIGFGLQNVVTNFVSGLIVLFQRPIERGDWIVVPSGEGIVRSIGAFTTELQTWDRASILVPNSELTSSAVQNWFYGDRMGRLKLNVGVSYDSDPEQVRSILMKVAQAHKLVLTYPTPSVIWTDFGDSALEFCLRAFVRRYDDAYGVTSDLRFAVFKAFKEAGISIPFPQRDLHIVQSADQ